MKIPKRILPTIVLAQFCCTSVWFAGNGVVEELVANFQLNATALGNLTSAVQFGFIIGTLIFAIFAIADRFSPSKVFLASAALGALVNLGVIWEGNTLVTLLSLRFFTGILLAGIYPIGMKIAADYFGKNLAKSLGFLVGALVLGTAFPHLLKELSGALPWKTVLIGTSLLSLTGGLLMLALVPDGPNRKASVKAKLTDCFNVFRKPAFRSAAFGYFGHMWELYAFWAFVPVMLKTYSLQHPNTAFNIPLLSFFIIGIGGPACILSGLLAQKIGARKVAYTSLLLSGFCCLFAPLLFGAEQEMVFVGYLAFWGMVVVADSPLLSTLVAENANAEIKGTALTIVTCIGFAITIVSIQLITTLLSHTSNTAIYALLAIGPILGLPALRKGLANS